MTTNSFARLLLLAVALLPLTACGVPDHGRVWLSFSSWDDGCTTKSDCSKLTDDAWASSYYQYIGAEDANGNPRFNFEQWKQLFGYYESTPVRAVYGNRLDLQFGRDMNCWEPSGTRQVVCYVTNYGTSPVSFPDTPYEVESGWPGGDGINKAGDGDIHQSLATVAMVVDPNWRGIDPGGIRYYAFGPTDSDGNQPLIRSVALDGEGRKNVPDMCRSCHAGGSHVDWVHKDNFLPFDVQSFGFSAGKFDDQGRLVEPSPFTLDNQQEAFRQLNAMVLRTGPTPAISHLIDGWYGGNVNTPGATVPDDTYLPAGWNTDRTSRKVYRSVIRPYCRTCHVANLGSLAFENVADFDPELVARAVCEQHSMPNAEVPYGDTFVPGENHDIFYFSRFGESRGFWVDEVAKNDFREYIKQHYHAGCE